MTSELRDEEEDGLLKMFTVGLYNKDLWCGEDVASKESYERDRGQFSVRGERDKVQVQRA